MAGDRTLWKHVNLTAYELDLTKMWKIIRNHFSDVLLSLHLKGHLDQGNVIGNVFLTFKSPCTFICRPTPYSEHFNSLLKLELGKSDLNNKMNVLPSLISYISLLQNNLGLDLNVLICKLAILTRLL